MTCAEFQAVLPDILEGTGTAEERDHLAVCSACSDLVSDFHLISQQARMLRASDEPNQRVWNSLEIALRQEGLIREAKLEPSLAPGRPFRRWAFAWFLPATAAFLVTLGVLRYEKPVAPPEVVQQIAPVPAVVASTAPASASSEADLKGDRQLLEVVGSRSPSLRASYETELQRVNAYIRDAEQSARAHPDDEAAQQYVMNAYEQKAMVYELAMDRSLQ